ncbi:hypothetical protein NLJ89_g11090 [Agrocybe chaxingu]|uniref:NACHT domain-containing protein n=1 Tax=Agrocybe chaxingu TaxID=84603 RepID=A0A9W8JQ04_9AGAR|nr:hypothetical protein NLJ89_g11090 [Agrocybe chaxingu]
MIPNAQVPFMVFIVDALDECGTYEDQLAFLDQIRLVLQCAPTVRFLISSREETHLGLKFGDPLFSPITERYALDWDRNATEDIKKVLERGFQDIRRQHASWVGHMDSCTNPKGPWPGMDVIDRLSEAASGQYIYASTVLDFVKKGQPLEKLQVVTDPEYISTAPGRNTVAHAFKRLDDLYSQILSNDALIPSCVGSILGLLNSTTFPQRPEVIANLLGFNVADVHETLTAISPLLKVHDLKTPTSEDERIVAIFGHDYFQYEISHTSLRDFLGNPERSGELAHYTVDIKKVALINFFNLVEEAFTEYKIGPRVSVRDSTWHFFRNDFSSAFQLNEVQFDEVSSYLTNSGLKNLWPNITMGSGNRAYNVHFRELILATSASISVLQTWGTKFDSWINKILRPKLFEFYSTMFPNIQTLMDCLPYHIITGSWFTSHYIRNAAHANTGFAENFLQDYRPIIEVELQSPRWQSTDRAYSITESFIDYLARDLKILGSAYREHYVLVTAWCLKGAIRAVQTGDPSFFTRIFGVVITDFMNREITILGQEEEFQRGYAMRELLDTVLTLDLSNDILNDDSDHATAVWQMLFWYYLLDEKIFLAESQTDHSAESEVDREFWQKSTAFFEEISEHRSFNRCSAIQNSVKYRYNLWEDNATGILDARLYNKDGCFVDCTNEKNDASWFQGFKGFARRFR